MQTVMNMHYNFSFFIYLRWNSAVEKQVSGACKMLSGLLCAHSCLSVVCGLCSVTCPQEDATGALQQHLKQQLK